MAMITLNALLELAKSQEGYLEKKSPADEDSMTGNAGANNYTKYGRDLKKALGSPYADGVAWCDEFVDWLFWKLGGNNAVTENLYGKSAYTPTSAGYFKNNNAWYHGKAPKPGYQIFFKNSQRICHTGIVTACHGGYVYTIEGNTSSASGVVANGGGVKAKSYPVTYNKIAGYGIPKCFKDSASTPAVDLRPQIKEAQNYINKNFMTTLVNNHVVKSAIAVDGAYGKTTRQCILGMWKIHVDEAFGGKLDPANSLFGTNCLALSTKCTIKKGDVGVLVECAQCLLKIFGYYSGQITGKFDDELQKAVHAYEVSNSLVSENPAYIGRQVWYSLFN